MQFKSFFTQFRKLTTVAITAFFSIGSAWGEATTIYQETFGDNGTNNTAVASATCYTATTSMFTAGHQTTVVENYSSSGKVGKNNINASDNSGASGNSAVWYTASTGTNTNTLFQVQNININGYSSLSLKFNLYRTNGASSTNAITVKYQIDNNTEQTLSYTVPSNNAEWTWCSGSLTGTGSSLRITFSMYTTGGFTTRLDDIILTGTAASCGTNPSAPEGAKGACLNGPFKLSSLTGSIGVKTSGWTVGSNCSWDDYGFVWSLGTNTMAPTVGGTKCNTVQKGTDGDATNWTDNLTPSGLTDPEAWETGKTYYVRAYGKNKYASGSYQYTSAYPFTPQSITYKDGASTLATHYVPKDSIVPSGNRLADPTKTGYTFSNWCAKSDLSADFIWSNAITKDTILYAKWTTNSYTVHFNKNSEDATGTTADESYDYDESKALTSCGFSLEGHTFAGWATTTDGDVAYSDGESVSNLSSTDGATVELFAKWTPINYSVTWKVNNSAWTPKTTTGEGTDGSADADYGSKVSTLPTAPADNTLSNCTNKFMGWSKKDAGTTAKPTSYYDDLFTDVAGSPTITGATVFYAVFAEGDTEHSSITSYSDGYYYLIDTYSSNYYAMTGNVSSGAISGTSLTSAVSFHSENNTISLDLTDGAITSSMVYHVTLSDGIYTITAPNGKAVTSKNNSADLTENSDTYKWNTLATNANFSNRFGFDCSSSTRCILYNNSSNGFKNYATSNRNAANYGTGYLYLVPARTFSNYVTQCDANQVRVVYDANGGVAPSCAGGVTTKSASYEVCSTKPTKTGYDFTGWNDGSSDYDAGATYNLTATTTFTAQWSAHAYTITYKDKDNADYSGDNAESLVGTHTYNSGTDLVAGTRGHDRFEGWYTTSNCSGDPVTSLGATDYTADITLYAKWATRYKIDFDVYGDKTYTIYRASDENMSASVAGQGSVPSDPGAPSGCSSKEFVGWTKTEIDGTTDDEPADLLNPAAGTVSGNTTFYAVWATVDESTTDYATECCTRYTITGASTSGTDVTSGILTSSRDGGCEGRVITLTATPKTGYTWDGEWIITKTSGGNDVTTTVLTDKTANPATLTMPAYGVTVSTSFTENVVTNWTWTYNGEAIPDPIEIYVGQSAQVDVVYTPDASYLTASHKNNNAYTHIVNSTYIASPSRSGDHFTFSGKASTGESTTSITLIHNDDKSEPKEFPLTFNVKVISLPSVTFIDLIQDKIDFSGGSSYTAGTGVLTSSVSAGVVTHTVATPTHDDVVSPGNNSTCENTHLHFVGWIESTWAEAYLDVVDGSMPNKATIEAADGWIEAGDDIDVEANDGKTYYAVWSTIE